MNGAHHSTGENMRTMQALIDTVDWLVEASILTGYAMLTAGAIFIDVIAAGLSNIRRALVAA